MTLSFILESIRTLLTESISYDYKIPSDREKQIYDLYLLSMYDDLLSHRESGTMLQPGWDEDTEADMRSIVKDGLDQLAEHMQKDYVKAASLAIASELRHVFDKKMINQDGIFEALGTEEAEKFMRFLRRNVMYGGIASSNQELMRNQPRERKRDNWLKAGRKESYSAAWKAFTKSGLSVYELADIGRKLFPLDIWSSAFGGGRWADISDALAKLDVASNTRSRVLALDHIIDLAHNTGLMIDKSADFVKNNSFGWVKTALDFKARAHPDELAEKSSMPAKLTGRVNRALNLGSSKADKGKDAESVPKFSAGKKRENKIQGIASVVDKKTKDAGHSLFWNIYVHKPPQHYASFFSQVGKLSLDSLSNALF